MRDVNYGWLIRYLHSNTASFFFFLVYLHIGKGIYYGSYRAPRGLVWFIGTIILVLMMATTKWPNWIVNIIYKGGVRCLSLFPFSRARTKAILRIGPHSKEVLSVIVCRRYTSLNKNNINPNFITGFCDAEACFSLKLSIRNSNSSSLNLSPAFSIHLHNKDLPLLYKIKSFFKDIGSITIKKSDNSCTFYVSSLSDLLNIIIPHFQQYPLRSAKNIDFLLWAQCVQLMANKELSTKDRLNKILLLKSALNKGLSESIKVKFPEIVPMVRPNYTVSKIPLNPDWISGFSDGDSCFYVTITKTNYVRAVYQIELHEREITLINKIQEFFKGIGRISYTSNRQLVRFTVAKQQDLFNIVIPHFDTYLLEGNKNKDYLIWRNILLLVKSKSHLKPEGLSQIIELKKKLNI
jgi:hypothetical protein